MKVESTERKNVRKTEQPKTEELQRDEWRGRERHQIREIARCKEERRARKERI